MATRYAVATGNWSDTATWDGGTLPTSSDDVYADGKTVTIDQNVTVLSLRTTARSGGTAGGGFAVSGAYTITASGTGILAGSTDCLTCSNALGTTVTVTAAATGGGTSNADGVVASGAGTVNITGAVNGGTAVTTHGVHILGAGTVSVTGSVTGGTNSQAYAIKIAANATVTVTGALTGGSGADGGALWVFSNCTLTVTGNVTGGAANAQASGIAIDTTGNPTITVTGTITAGAAPAIGQRGDGASRGSTVTLTGPFICSSNGLLPIAGWSNVKLSAIVNNEFRFKSSGTGTASLWSSDVNSGAPSVANVRSGTTFGVSNEFTGTLAVPPANSVASGVPVDNTVGTAALSPSDLSSVIGAAIAAALDSVP